MIYALGPAGTFSDKAAARLNGTYTPPRRRSLLPSISGVFERVVSEEGAIGVVPIENSIAGTVDLVQDLLSRHDVWIHDEIQIPVAFKLLARGEVIRAQRVFVHPVAERQCAEGIRSAAPSATLVFTDSNTDSAERLLAAGDLPTAAVVPVDYAPPPGANLTEVDLASADNNATRFLAIRRSSSQPEVDVGRQKLSLFIAPHTNRPGLLHDILGTLKRHEMNLSRIESRPGREPWQYLFFLDASITAGAPAAWQELQRGDWDARLLGCYSVVP